MLTDAQLRREIAYEAAIERAKRKMRFDGSVARHFVDGVAVRASAAILGCTKKQVEGSRVVQGFSGRGVEGEPRFEAQLKNSLRVRQFHAEVLRLFSAGLGAAETAEQLKSDMGQVRLARAWLGLETGRSTYRQGRLTGRLTTRAAIEELRGQ